MARLAVAVAVTMFVVLRATRPYHAPTPSAPPVATSNGTASPLTKKKLSPIRWRTFGYQDLRTFFQCDAAGHWNGSPSQEQWSELRTYYRQFAEENRRLGRTYPLPSDASGNVAVVSANDRDPAGHHYAAAHDISVNSPIAIPANHAVVFSNGRLFRSFAWSVHHDRHRELTCRLLSNARVVDDPSHSKKKVIVVELSGHIAIDTASTEKENVVCTDGTNCIAKQGIPKGARLQTSKVAKKIDAAEEEGRWKLMGL